MKPEIPKGWRELPLHATIRDGDKASDGSQPWMASECVGQKVGWDADWPPRFRYIRRIVKRRAKK